MRLPTQLLALQGHLQLEPTWVLLLAALGFFRVAKLCFFLLHWVYVAFLRPPRDLRTYGSWALVTGATDGIGKSLAFRLAGQGLNLVLVGRNPDKLRSVSASIRASHPETRLESVVLDFAGDTAEGIRQIRELAEALDVGVVVNNAGVAFPRPLYFHEVEERTWMDVVRVNLVGLTAVTRAVLPAMLRRRRGALVNIGSAAAGGYPSFPFYCVYAATKGYVGVLSRSLDQEYRKSGIHVQCQVPFFVATKIIDGLVPNLFHLLLATHPDAYARAATHWIGHESWCIPCWQHFIQASMYQLLPEFIMDNWIYSVNFSQR